MDIPTHKYIDSGKALQRVRPPDGQKFYVMAYVLSDEAKVKGGMYGMMNFLGAYPTAEAANQRVAFLKQTTGYPHIFARRVGHWEELTLAAKLDTTTPPPVHDRSTKPVATQPSSAETPAGTEIRQEQEKAKDVTTVEHYIQQWYQLIRTKGQLAKLEKGPKVNEAEYSRQHQELTKACESRILALREQAGRQPEMETLWLDVLKTRMEKRGEKHVFEMIKAGAEKIRPEVFVPPPPVTPSPAAKPERELVVAIPVSQPAPPEVVPPQPEPNEPAVTLRPVKPKGTTVGPMVEAIERLAEPAP